MRGLHVRPDAVEPVSLRRWVRATHTRSWQLIISATSPRHAQGKYGDLWEYVQAAVSYNNYKLSKIMLDLISAECPRALSSCNWEATMGPLIACFPDLFHTLLCKLQVRLRMRVALNGMEVMRISERCRWPAGGAPDLVVCNVIRRFLPTGTSAHHDVVFFPLPPPSQAGHVGL